MRLLYVSLGIFMTSFPALAGVESIEVTGTGNSSSSAVDAALMSAVEQISGVTISSQRQSFDQSSRRSGEGTQFLRQSSGVKDFGTAGRATYRILSQFCNDGECTVRLLANVEVNDDVERQKKLRGMNKNRRTIAIEPFQGRLAQEFTRAIEARFVQDRKFRVIADRNLPGVDYVLKGRVLEAQTDKTVVDNSRTVKLTGEYIEDVKVSYDSRVVVEYQVIDLVNNQVKWSAKVPTTSSRDNLAKLLDISSRKVFEQLKGNIYPLVLLASEDGTLVLNSGGSTVRVGEYYDVFAAGEKMVDPVTKESLGFVETKVAQIIVTRVMPKMAYAELVKGNRDDLLELPIVRKSAQSVNKPKEKQPEEAPLKRTSGIVL